MLRNGIPREIGIALRAVTASFRGWGSAVDVTRTVSEGDVLEFARARLARAPPAGALAVATRSSTTRPPAS